MTFQRGDIVELAQPWPAQHRGIFAGFDAYGRALVIHNPKGGSVRYDLLEVFACGQQVRLINRVAQNSDQQNLILARAHSLLGKEYDFLRFNCDHLVTYALAGVATSPRLQAVAVLALVIGLGVALTATARA